MEVKARAAFDQDASFKAHSFTRRKVGESDVAIDISYCGICHSDIHTAKSEWGPAQYPCVPGHEIVGVVKEVGSKVERFKAGDRVGVGCLVGSCRGCRSCESDLENYCENGWVGTYGSPVEYEDGYTKGGYSTGIVVDSHFVLKVPDNLDLAAAAPLLCAGITTYSPLRFVGAGPGHKIGVVGLGGLGHMAVKLAKSFGCEVTMISRSEHKRADAERLGAHNFLLSTDALAMNQAMGQFDFIVDTVSAPHDVAQLLNTLKLEGTLIMVGASDKELPLNVFPLLFGRRKILGSLIGGLKETQEMLDHCGKHGIVSDIEMIKADQIDSAWDRVLKSDVKYRFVIDCQTI